MNIYYSILGFISCLLFFIFIGCEKEGKLPTNYAKGKIIAITGQCYGEIVIIEVVNPEGIGVKGTFSTINKEIDISYENAIATPYFSKIGLPDSIPQIVGTKLYFEYRELTTEELENGHLFETNEPIICLMNIAGPSANPYIIKKIISFEY